MGGEFFYPVLRDLKRYKIDYIIIGGIARLLHGTDMVTSDIDIVICKKIKECGKLLEFAKEKKYLFRIGDEDFKLKRPEDLYPLRFVKMIHGKRRGIPLPDIDVFLDRTYDDTPFYLIEYEEIMIGKLKVKIATEKWLIEHRGDRGKDDVATEIMVRNMGLRRE